MTLEVAVLLEIGKSSPQRPPGMKPILSNVSENSRGKETGTHQGHIGSTRRKPLKLPTWMGHGRKQLINAEEGE